MARKSPAVASRTVHVIMVSYGPGFGTRRKKISAAVSSTPAIPPVTTPTYVADRENLEPLPESMTLPYRP
jgi:hypothetical protein